MTKNKTNYIALICIYLAMWAFAMDPTNDGFQKRIQKMSIGEQDQIKDENHASIRSQIQISNEIESEKSFNNWLGEKEEQLMADVALDQQLHPIRQKRQVICAYAERWPRIIDYEINFPERKSDILRAIRQWEDYSCLTFRENASAKPRLRFSVGDRNLSEIGMKPGDDGYPEVKFYYDATMTTITHELGHALGFEHTHQRKDRDEYLIMFESNIREEWKSEFEILHCTRNLDVPYDPASIMGYRGHVGMDPVKVMVTKDERYKRALGQSMHPTFCDLLLLNIFYGCKDVCEKFKTKCHLGGGFPNPKDCTKCICPSGFGGNSCMEPTGTCGRILEATENPKIFAETVGSFENYPHAQNLRRKRHVGIWQGGNAECHWHIRAPPSHRIKLRILLLTAIDHESCDYGFAEVKIRKEMRPAGIRYCCPEDLKSKDQIYLESEINLVVVSLYGNIHFEFEYHTYENRDSLSSIIRWSEAVPKSIRPSHSGSIRTQEKSESNPSQQEGSIRSKGKSIQSKHEKSIRPKKKSESSKSKHEESIRSKEKTKSIRSSQGETKSIRQL